MSTCVLCETDYARIRVFRGFVYDQVAGVINEGDKVIIEVYETPAWLVRDTD